MNYGAGKGSLDGESDAMIVPRAVGYHVEEESGDFTAEKTTASKTTASKNSIVIWIAPLLLVVAGLILYVLLSATGPDRSMYALEEHVRVGGPMANTRNAFACVHADGSHEHMVGMVDTVPSEADATTCPYVLASATLNRTMPQLLIPNNPALGLGNPAGVLYWLSVCEQFEVVLHLIVFDEVCGSSGIYVSSGANEGTFSLLAAKSGCKAIAVEPQPSCVEAIAKAAKVNAIPPKQIALENVFLSAIPMTDSVLVGTCSGTNFFGVTEKGAYENKAKEILSASADVSKMEKREVHSKRLDEVVLPPDIIELWHIDVEGAEILVMRSAAHVLREGRVRRIIIEIEPQRWHKWGITPADGLRELKEYFHGWHCITAGNGKPYIFDKAPQEYGKVANLWREQRVNRHGVGIDRLALVDVYCVAPGLENDASFRALSRPWAQRGMFSPWLTYV